MESPDFQQRFSHAATRPFGDNAEIKISAARWLEENARADEGAMTAATARWDKVDAGGHRKLWQWILPVIALLVSAIVIIQDAGETWRHFQWAKSSTRDLVDAPKGRKARITQGLSAKQKLLIPRSEEEGGPLSSSRELWESEPANAAWYSEYATSFIRENRSLPPEFLATARKLEPDNAWFTCLAASVEAKNSVEQKKDGSWEIKDAAKMERALALLREARDQQQYDNHAAAMIRTRLGILRHATFPDRMDAIVVMASAPLSSSMNLHPLSALIPAKASIAANASDTEAYRELSKDAAAFLHHLTRTEVATLLDEVIVWGMVATISNQFAKSAEKLALPDESALWNGIYTRLKQNKDARKKTGLLLTATTDPSLPVLTDTMSLVASSTTKDPPPLAPERLQPLKAMEHSALALFTGCAVCTLMVFCAVATAVYPFRVSKLHRGLARRAMNLLDWRAGLWIAGAGVLLPFLYVVAINFFTPLGGRHLSLGFTAFLLPTAQLLGLWMLWLTATPQVVGWRLAKRAGVMGFTRSPWPGRVATVAAIAFVPLIGWAATSGSFAGWWANILDDLDLTAVDATPSSVLFWTATGVLGLAITIVLIRIAVAIFSRPRRRVHRAASAMALANAYAGAVILMALGAWAAKANAQYWFERDTVTKTSASIPGWSAYEYEVAVQMRKELHEVLASSAPSGPLPK